MEAQGAGAIVNISSVAGLRFIGNQPRGLCGRRRPGLVQFTKAVGVQYAARGVRCNSISVGLMHTPLVEARLAAQYGEGDLQALVAKRHAQVPMGRMGSGWDVAHAALLPGFGRGGLRDRGRSGRGRRAHREVRLRARTGRP